MEAPAELLAALPALATALALLLAWLLVRRGPAASPDPAGASPGPAPPAEASGTPAPPDTGAPEPAAAPQGPGERAGPAEAEEQAAQARQEEEKEEEQDGEEGSPPAGPEDEDGGEAFSFKYSPGKLRGNQYKKMMTKEELEEEQRVQKEQLAAIFKLMQDNKETFGEMSDGDVQEQLRLYDM
uniref:Matrix remodeling associated 7 n=2 Tax=Rousettus aegyptiacus TaxID=9407 RepID=A0A7J8GCU0_ROUAE|nr:matrix remodeling associated 7 [Rousettus aegyptiacus]